MKNIINILLISLLALFTLNSCDDPVYPQFANGEGKLSTATLKVSVLTDPEVKVDRSNDEDVSTYTVNIIQKSTSNIVNTWKYSEMPEIITLPVGDYKVEVFNAAVKDAEWDAPYYYASKDFSIVKNEITEIGTITCKLANVKVTIKYTDELKALIGEGKDVKVNVAIGELGSLDFGYGETRSGFFRYVPTSTTLVATFSGTVDGFFMSEFKVLEDIAAGQHRIITFGVKQAPDPEQEYGMIGTSGLVLNAKVTRIDLTINVPAGEEPIDPDDMLSVGSKNVKVTATNSWIASSDQMWCTLSATSGAKGTNDVTINATENSSDQARTAKVTFVMGNISQVVTVTQAAKGSATSPTITSSTLNLDAVNPITDGMVAKVDIIAPNGIAHLNVTIESPSLTPDDLKDVGLSDKFDLAYPGEFSEPLSSLGFPTGDKVINQKSLVFDITPFMGLLGQFPGEHHFIIKVEDNNGETVTATLKFLAQ